MLRALFPLLLTALLTSWVHAELVQTISEFDFEQFQNTDDYFSNDSSAPTPIGELPVGSTQVSGFLGPVVFDADIFTFTIAAGTRLNAIRLLSIDGDGHFFGVDEGNTSIPPVNYDGSSLLVARLIGGTDINTNLLDPVPPTGSNFNDANEAVVAGPGEYTVWLQENAVSEPYTYALSLDVGVVAIPEPSSAALGFFALGGWMVRRRRSCPRHLAVSR